MDWVSLIGKAMVMCGGLNFDVSGMSFAISRNNKSAIPPPADLDFSIYNSQTRELLDEVYVVFGQYSAWKLYQMTHFLLRILR